MNLCSVALLTVSILFSASTVSAIETDQKSLNMPQVVGNDTNNIAQYILNNSVEIGCGALALAGLSTVAYYLYLDYRAYENLEKDRKTRGKITLGELSKGLAFIFSSIEI